MCAMHRLQQFSCFQRHLLTRWAVLVLAMFAASNASAETVFSENFQDGEYASNWTLSGNGHDTVNYSYYYDNYSMRLDGLREGVIPVSTSGYGNVSLSMDMAGLYLVTGDYCYAEYSADAGNSWHVVQMIGNGSDDGLFRTGTVSTGIDDNPNIRLRFRAYTLFYNYCYGDNVSVTGTPISAGDIYDPFDGNGSVSRSKLSYGFLTGSGALNLIDYSHYAVPTEAANPINTFEGTLTMIGEASHGNVVEVGGNDNLQYYTDAAHLPEFEFEFVQHGTHLIPTARGMVEGAHSSWTYVLEPGRVWNENGDNGYSRVALPFALQERNQDCIWNGVLTFLFKDDGSVSDVAYQIAAETCLYMKLNFWGRLEASYTPGAVAGAQQIKDAYAAEVAGRMPIKPISALATDYPGSGIVTANIGSDVTPAHMTIFGVAFNGVHYVGGCDTRYGDYPFCSLMDVPSYSTAKSVNGAYGLMRLEQKYAGNQRDLFIGDYVSECGAWQWNAPTFENALDMATGNYTSSISHADESSQAMFDNFFVPETHAAKAGFACGYSRRSTPGTLFVYHTSDSYLLGRAINEYYQAQVSGSADFYRDVMVEDIYKPLGLSPTTYTTLRTRDSQSQAHTGFGMIYVRDDVVKLAEFLGDDGGAIDGVQLLDSQMVAATTQLGSGGLAAPAGNSWSRYNNGFWYFDLDQATHEYGCNAPAWVPYMSGYGGITVVLFPNGAVYYHFSDNDELGWGNAGIELDKIAPMCP